MSLTYQSGLWESQRNKCTSQSGRAARKWARIWARARDITIGPYTAATSGRETTTTRGGTPQGWRDIQGPSERGIRRTSTCAYTLMARVANHQKCVLSRTSPGLCQARRTSEQHSPRAHRGNICTTHAMSPSGADYITSATVLTKHHVTRKLCHKHDHHASQLAKANVYLCTTTRCGTAFCWRSLLQNPWLFLKTQKSVSKKIQHAPRHAQLCTSVHRGQPCFSCKLAALGEFKTQRLRQERLQNVFRHFIKKVNKV